MHPLRALVLLPVVLPLGPAGTALAQRYGVEAYAIVRADDLVDTFEHVCVDSQGMDDAIERAEALPRSQLSKQDGRPKSYRVYEMPDRAVGIWGRRRFTCYVVGLLGLDEDLGAVVARLEALRGKEIKVRKRGKRTSYASWRDRGMTYRFEDSPQETGHFVLISLRNKQRD